MEKISCLDCASFDTEACLTCPIGNKEDYSDMETEELSEIIAQMIKEINESPD